MDQTIGENSGRQRPYIIARLFILQSLFTFKTELRDPHFFQNYQLTGTPWAQNHGCLTFSLDDFVIVYWNRVTFHVLLYQDIFFRTICNTLFLLFQTFNEHELLSQLWQNYHPCLSNGFAKPPYLLQTEFKLVSLLRYFSSNNTSRYCDLLEQQTLALQSCQKDREWVRNLDLRVQVHPGELCISNQRVHISVVILL